MPRQATFARLGRLAPPDLGQQALPTPDLGQEVATRGTHQRYLG